MSTTIDNKVVEMRFDNKQFEQGVSTTMSTLEKLKERLNLKGATKGLEEVGSAAKNVDMTGLGRAVETVQTKFSALSVMGVTALANITNSAVNAGKRMISALTIDPISTGFSEYETKMNAVQTIMANTSSKGKTMDDVTRVLDELNTYADKTIYNFAEMTRNIGTFTAAGVGLEESATAIQGIANLAAVSGSNSQQASTAMYQLSQAMASGTVKLMDWNSVVNAGMGGQVFQDALKETARTHGVAVDDMIKKAGSFRESLQDGWITTEILTETLAKMTKGGAAEYLSKLTGVEQKQIETAQKLVAENKDGSASYEELATQLAATGKISKDKAIDILKMADTAEDAATKVKTFTQLWDTLKESAQSGWSQTWEILVGDFEEAKETLTSISEVIGKAIEASAKARNDLLQGWKDAGGRADLVDSLFNVINGIGSIIKPIKEAFREIFPPTTVEQLVGFTKGLKELTAKLTISDATAAKLKNTFKGIFSAISIVVDIIKAVVGGFVSLIKSFSGVEGGLLGLTSAIGGWITNLRDAIRENGIFESAVKFLVKPIITVINVLKTFGTTAKEAFQSKGVQGFANVFKGVWNIIQKIGEKMGAVFSSISEGMSKVFAGDNAFDLVNKGLFGAVLVGITKFIKSLTDSVGEVGGFLENITGILDDVRGCFEAYQQNLKAKTLLKIASAIGILAISLAVIASISSDKLGSSLAAITTLFLELFGSMAIFEKIMGGAGFKSMGKITTAMIKLSVSLLILSAALKIMGSMSWGEIGRGLTAMAGGLGLLVAAVNLLPENNVNKAAKAIKKLSVSLLILSAALKIMGSMSWDEIGRGLTAMTGGLAVMIAALWLMPKDMSSKAFAMIGLATALVILGGAMKIMGSMQWDEIGKGLVGLAGALLVIAGAMWLMPPNMLLTGAGLLVVAAALVVLGGAMKIMGSMSWDEIGKGLTVLAGALIILAVGMTAMIASLPGAAAMLIVAAALAILTPVLLTLGSMSWGSICKGLVALAGAFAIIGVAGLLLQPLIPVLLGLGAAIALLGVGIAAVGVGILAFSAGMAALAVSGVAGAAALTNIIVAVLTLIPTIATAIAQGIITFAAVIAAGAPIIGQAITSLLLAVISCLTTCIPPLVECLGVLVTALLNYLISAIPQFVVAGLKIITGLLQGIADNIGFIIEAGTNIIISFIQGVASALPRVINAGIQAMISFINGLADGIRTNTPAMIAAVNNLMDAVIGAIKAWFGNFVSKGGEIIGKIISGVKSKFSQFKSAAGDMMEGFIQGIKNKFTAIKNAAVNAIKGAVDGVKSFLGINSPSRVFSEMGGYSGEGFVLGLKEYSGAATKAAAELGKTTVDGLQKTLGIHSPAKVVKDKVGKYIVEGLAEGIEKDMSAEEAAEQKARNIVEAFQNELSKHDLDKTTSDLEYDLWEIQNESASAAEKTAKKAESIYKRVAAQTEKVALAQGEYQVTFEQFGETSEKTQKAYNKWIEEQISLNEETKSLLELRNQSIADATESASLDMDTHNLEYEKWLSQNTNASVVEKSSKDLEFALKDLPKQAETVGLAKATYEDLKARLGVDANETKRAYNDWLQSEIDFSDMITNVQNKFTDAVGEQQKAKQTYFELLTANQDKMLKQGVSLDAIYDWASLQSGYDPRKHGDLLNFDVAGVIANAKSLVDETAAKYAGTTFLANVGDVAGNSIATGITNSAPAVETAVQTLGTACSQVANTNGSDWISLGKQFATKFAEGLTSAGEQIAQSAIFMVTSAYQAALDYINNAEANGIVLAPRISPVMDMSNIQNGAQQFNGMFAATTTALADVNVRLSNDSVAQMQSIANEMLANENANHAQLLNELFNIRGDLGSLAEALNELDINLDGNALVGSLSGRIDASLGRIATYKGRGN